MALPSQPLGAQFHTNAISSLIPLRLGHDFRIHPLLPGAGKRTPLCQLYSRSLSRSRPFSSLAAAPSPLSFSSAVDAPQLTSTVGAGGDAPQLTSTVGSPPLAPVARWNLGPTHILLLNVTACVVS